MDYPKVETFGTSMDEFSGAQPLAFRHRCVLVQLTTLMCTRQIGTVPTKATADIILFDGHWDATPRTFKHKISFTALVRLTFDPQWRFVVHK